MCVANVNVAFNFLFYEDSKNKCALREATHTAPILGKVTVSKLLSVLKQQYAKKYRLIF